MQTALEVAIGSSKKQKTTEGAVTPVVSTQNRVQMNWNTPRFAATYQPKRLEPRAIEGVVQDVEREFHNTRLVCTEIESYQPKYTLRTHRPGMKELARAIEREYEKIRKWTMTLGKRPLSTLSKGLVLGPRLELVSRINHSEPRIVLVGSECPRVDFEAFEEICMNYLSLETHPDYTHQYEDGLIRAWFSDCRLDAQLRKATKGAIQTRAYDVALNAAISVVESRLRDRCVAAGRFEAKHQTGTELAVTAYQKDRGCLEPPWDLATEARQGAQLLFHGFFMWLRNAYAHHAVVMDDDRDAVVASLMTCQFLLTVIERSTPRTAD